MYKKALLIFVLVFSLHSTAVRAEVRINELSYFPPASKQWIEIYNDTDSEVDITEYKILDAGAAVNGHGISTVSDGASIIPAHAYGIIAKDPTSVSATYLFKSSLGMDKEGDTVTLKNLSTVVDTITFSDPLSEGNSLQLVNGSWVGANPTPGAANNSTPAEPPENPSGGSGNTSGSSSTSSSTSTQSQTKEVQKITAKILVKNVSFAGLPILFKAEAFGYSGEKLYQGKYFWNFGDGDSKEVLDDKSFSHTYLYPADYAVSLEYYLSSYSDMPDVVSKIKIKVVPMGISISSIGDAKDFFVELTNNSAYDMDLSLWKLSTPAQSFILPRNTNILAKSKLILSSQVTHFTNTNNQIENQNGVIIKLLTPTGDTISEYSVTPVVANVDPIVPEKIKVQDKKTTVAEPVIPKENEISVSTAIEPSQNLTASVISNDVLEKNSSHGYILGTILVIFLGFSASAVYLIRRSSFISQHSQEFEILDE